MGSRRRGSHSPAKDASQDSVTWVNHSHFGHSGEGAGVQISPSRSLCPGSGGSVEVVAAPHSNALLNALALVLVIAVDRKPGEELSKNAFSFNDASPALPQHAFSQSPAIQIHF